MKALVVLIAMFGSTVWAVAVPGAPLTTVQVGKVVILADRNEISVYTFDPDEPGVSNCYNHCAKEWPPVLAKAGETVVAPYSLVARKDGTSQLAYKDQPLYNYDDDKKKGDIEGDGKGGVWHLVDIAQ